MSNSNNKNDDKSQDAQNDAKDDATQSPPAEQPPAQAETDDDMEVTANVVGADGKTAFAKGQLITEKERRKGKLDKKYTRPVTHDRAMRSPRDP